MADQQEPPRASPPPEERQCRICLDGADVTLGRLIRPCLCKGSMSYVHIGCLKRWRDSSIDKNFFACPVCHYKYRLGRTLVVGIATNPVILGVFSSVFFTAIVIAASFITTYFMSFFEETSMSYEDSYYFSYHMFPFDVGKDLVRAALRILKDKNEHIMDEDAFFTEPEVNVAAAAAKVSPGLLKRLLRRFMLGLPMVGAISIVQVLLSLPILGPVHGLARYRGNRNRRGATTDVATALVIMVLLFGAARALYKVYEFTKTKTRRLLLRAEDAILEVN